MSDYEFEAPPGPYVPPPVGAPEDNGAEPADSTTVERWQPVPLAVAAAAAGDSPRPVHGQGLVYGSSAVTLLSGEPGVGKSMLLAILMAEEILAGGRPLYLDFERMPQMLDERLAAAGLSEEDRNRVGYLRPLVQSQPKEIRAMVADHAPTLIGLDAYDAALQAFGKETKNEDVRAFHALVVEPLRNSGAPVVVADHVVKDAKQRGRYTIGGQAKLALAEAHLGVTAISHLRRKTGGRLKVKVHKDTFGWLPLSAVVKVTSHELTGALSWTFTLDEDGGEGEDDDFRPTGLMEKVSRALEIAGEAQSRNKLEEVVKGKRDYVRQAIDVLVREGFCEEVPGARGSRLVTLVRPFREDDE